MSNKKIKLIKEDETSADDLLKTMLKTMEANGLEIMGTLSNCPTSRKIPRNRKRR